MGFAKTPSGRDALRRRDPSLNRFERQLLIVANGYRDERDLATLMCQPVDDMIERLIALGYLSRVQDDEQLAFSDTGTLEHPRLAPSGHHAATPAAPKVARSLAGCKMYLLGVLSLQRTSDAALMAVDVHLAETHEDFLAVLAVCLRDLDKRNGATYARRVARKLGQMLPQAYLSTFADALREQLPPEVLGAFIDEASKTVAMAVIVGEHESTALA